MLERSFPRGALRSRWHGGRSCFRAAEPPHGVGADDRARRFGLLGLAVLALVLRADGLSVDEDMVVRPCGACQPAALTFGFQNFGPVERSQPTSFHHADKPVLAFNGCLASLPSQNQDRRVARISAFFSIRYWPIAVIVGYLSVCAAAFDTPQPMAMTSARPIVSSDLRVISPPSSLEPSSACRLLPPSLLTCLAQVAHIKRWPNLESIAVRQRGMLRHELYRMIHVPRLKDENAAKLFLGFCIGTVRGCDFAVLPIQGQRGFRRLKRFSTRPMPVGAKMVIVFKTCVEHGVLFGLSHAVKFAFVVVSETDVFHCSSPHSGLPDSRALRRPVHLFTMARVPWAQWPGCLLAFAGFLCRSREEKKLAHFAGHIAGDGSLLRPGKCLIEIGGFQYPESAHVLLGLGVWPVGDEHPAVGLLPQRLRVGGWRNAAGELPGAGRDQFAVERVDLFDHFFR